MKSAQRKMARSTRRLIVCVSSCLLPFAVCHLGGCQSGSPSTQPSTPSARQDAAMNDPMGYKPQFGHPIGGSDMTSFDKDGFNRDMHDVMNP
jgi:hypothetical protein